ncbi:NTE family protein [Bradyrhizobium sp. LM6.10]
MLDILKGRGSNGEKVGLGSIRRPVIGLALGGGAARGFAHIGILRTLLANGIVPDVVVGTSIGAVVGGLHAAGRLDTLEEWGRSLQGMRNILGYLDIRLNGSGLIGGEKLATRLEEAVGQTLIEDLPIKFASVATEVRTGHEIWLTRGRVVDAMRASYALPGIFSPVLIGDRWLVDGALVNPVPVSAARALGAEIVIAANLSSDIFTYSTTVYSHGAMPEPVVPAGRRDDVKAALPEILLARKNGEARILRRRQRPARPLFGDGRCLQHHAGPHHPRPPRRRSARYADHTAGRPFRLVRLPPLRGPHRPGHPRRRASDGVHPRGNPRAGADAREHRAQSRPAGLIRPS